MAAEAYLPWLVRFRQELQDVDLWILSDGYCCSCGPHFFTVDVVSGRIRKGVFIGGGSLSSVRPPTFEYAGFMGGTSLSLEFARDMRSGSLTFNTTPELSI